jgi:NitT/TauT family transport system substrate-binding protein
MVARRAVIALLFLMLAGTHPATAAESLSVAVGGANIIAYLPVTIANELGYFKEAGVDVTINDVQSGTKMAEALVKRKHSISVQATTTASSRPRTGP